VFLVGEESVDFEKEKMVAFMAVDPPDIGIVWAGRRVWDSGGKLFEKKGPS